MNTPTAITHRTTETLQAAMKDGAPVFYRFGVPGEL